MNFNVGKVIAVGQLQYSGVAVQIPNFETLRYGLNLIADSGNTGNLYIGNSGVTVATGFIAERGHTLWFQTDSPSNLYVISNIGGIAQTLSYIGF